jgi:protoporphyrinogen oxidase
MIRGLADRCGSRLTTHVNCPVERVRPNGDGTFEVTAGGATHAFSRLVSTVPIGDLVARLDVACPPDVQAAVNGLRYNSIHITIVVAEQDNVGDNFAIMVPDSTVMFHRVSKLDFLGGAYHRPGTTTLMAETTFRPGDRFDLPARKISDTVVADLDRIGFVARAAVRHVETQTISHAYVVYDLNHRANADKALAWLRSLGILSFGRFGSFEYMNMDAALWQAREKALAFGG